MLYTYIYILIIIDSVAKYTLNTDSNNVER